MTLDWCHHADVLIEGQAFAVSAAAKALGTVEQTLADWVKADKSGQLRGVTSEQVSADRMENDRLRAELARATMERNIPHPTFKGPSAGTLTPKEIIADVKSGLYVTETVGFGVNPVTGDYSQGASGMWIENGEIAYPVEEITIAGNLKEMYKNIVAIGNDLVFRGASAAPTIRVEGMMVAGA